MHLPLDTFQLVITGIILTIGAAVQGSIGFGLAIIAAPVLLLIDPVMVPGPMIFSALILSILVTIRNRRSFDFADVKFAIIGRIPGTVAGVSMLILLPQSIVSVTLGSLILFAVLISLTGFRLQLSTRNLLFAGMLSGFMGSTSSIGGPPMALIYQHESGSRLRGTLGGYFIMGTIMSLVALHIGGQFGEKDLMISLLMLPGIFAGFVISLLSSNFLNQRFMRPAVLSFSSIAAIVVILKGLL